MTQKVHIRNLFSKVQNCTNVHYATMIHWVKFMAIFCLYLVSFKL